MSFQHSHCDGCFSVVVFLFSFIFFFDILSCWFSFMYLFLLFPSQFIVKSASYSYCNVSSTVQVFEMDFCRNGNVLNMNVNMESACFIFMDF